MPENGRDENLRLSERLASISAALQREPSSGICEAELVAMAKALVPFFKEVTAEAIAKAQELLVTRIAVIEQENAKLKATMLTDGGVWAAATLYPKGAVTTCHGAPWVANEPNSNAKPGTSNAWRLVGKSHR
jgi:hypothetical protein